MSAAVENGTGPVSVLTYDEELDPRKLYTHGWRKAYTCTGCQKSHYQPDERPFLLPCCHCLCQECVSLGEQGKRKRECGECSKPYTRDKLLPHYLAAQMLGPTKPLTFDLPKRVCTECPPETRPVAAFCLDCHLFMCCECSDVHAKFSAFREHERVGLTEAYSRSSLDFCANHRYKIASHYCSDCNGKTLCEACFEEEGHSEHESCRVEEATSVFGSSQEIARLKTDLEAARHVANLNLRTLRSQTSAIDRALSEANVKIKDAVVQVAEALKAASILLMKSVNGAILERHQVVERKVEDMREDVENMKQAHEFVEKFLVRSSVTTKIKMEKELAEMLKENVVSLKNNELSPEMKATPKMEVTVKGSVKEHVNTLIRNVLDVTFTGLGSTVLLYPGQGADDGGASGGGRSTPLDVASTNNRSPASPVLNKRARLSTASPPVVADITTTTTTSSSTSPSPVVPGPGSQLNKSTVAFGVGETGAVYMVACPSDNSAAGRSSNNNNSKPVELPAPAPLQARRPQRLITAVPITVINSNNNMDVNNVSMVSVGVGGHVGTGNGNATGQLPKSWHTPATPPALQNSTIVIQRRPSAQKNEVLTIDDDDDAVMESGE